MMGSERSGAPDRSAIRGQSTAATPPQDRVVDELLQRAHLAGAYDLPLLFQRHAEALGVGDAVTYLVDLQQSILIPFLPPPGLDEDERLTPLGVDSTLAGRAFQQSQLLVQSVAPNDPDDPAVRVWLPLLDGTERLGVLAVTAPDAALLHDGATLPARLRLFAALAAELVVSKSSYGDTLVRLRRSSQMGLAAEMQWSLLPPLTFSTSTVTVAGALEPAYEVAGDSVDYAVDDRVTRFAVFDGMGHGLRSAQLATLTVAAYRNGRRADRSLTMTAVSIDRTVASAFDGDMFITGVMVELDTDSGTLRWVNAGHPSALLLRDGRLVKELDVEPMLPFGLNDALDTGEEVELGVEQLEPGDMVLLYTDGVVEARSPGGEFFGVEQLVDLITRNLASGLAPPETMRRISHALLDHQQAQLDDDATLMLVQWRPVDPTQMLA